MSTSPNIYQRINAVMKEIDYIQKDSNVGFGNSAYKAVSHDNVVAQIRDHLLDQGIVIRVDQLRGEMLLWRDKAKEIKQHLYQGDYAVHFVNIDKPEDEAVVCVTAHAADTGDKAPGKAITYATKSAILKMFLLETGIDDESRTAEPEAPQAWPQDEFNKQYEKWQKAVVAGKHTAASILKFASSRGTLSEEQAAAINAIGEAQ